MPPSPLYNWLCVLHSASGILSHAASIRAAQVSRTNAELRKCLDLRDADRRSAPEVAQKPDSRDVEHAAEGNITWKTEAAYTSLDPNPGDVVANGTATTRERFPPILHAPARQSPAASSVEPLRVVGVTPESLNAELDRQASSVNVAEVPRAEALLTERAERSEGRDMPQTEAKLLETEFLPKKSHPPSQTQRNLQASRVPSSRIGRLFHYGGLAATLGYGAASEALRRVSSSQQNEEQTSLMMTPANIKRLVEKLSKMRGAALKLGQFMSIQDTHLLPKDVEEVFRRVQDSAHYMPNSQMERVMSDSLGPSWSSNFSSFDPIPFAAASLGQVHSAVLAAHASPTGKDEKVAVKIQFPDIAKSIESDLGYLKVLLNAGRILPRGLFLDKTLQVMKGELADECDYVKEAGAARFFGSEEGIGRDSRFRVPWVWDGSTERVLVMQHMDGVSVGGNIVDSLSQESRDQIASSILELCMKELFDLRMMQTDPNWSNFLWNEQRQQIELIDFGATRSYSKEFIDKWMHILQAAVTEDRGACIHWSLELGYLTGEESETMLDAHVRSLTLLATPFRARKNAFSSTDGGRYTFGKGTEWARVTAEIRSLIPVMLRERLTPPPRETYSLNRKLSGAFLLASRLRARVDCRTIWEATVEKYRFLQPS